MKKIFISVILIVSLTGCAPPHCHKLSNSSISKQPNMTQATKAIDKVPAPVVMHRGYYVDRRPVSLKKTPAWLKRRVNLHAENMPLSMLMDHLLNGSNVTTAYDSTVDTNILVSMKYNGTVKGVLNHLAAKLNYAYILADHEVDWSAYATKSYSVSFVPVASNPLVSAAVNGEGRHSSGVFPVWHDLRHIFGELKSKNGTVYVSAATKSITVHDRPSNIAAMSRLIETMNVAASKKIGTGKKQASSQEA